MADRVPPHNLDAEQCIIGACLHSNEATWTASSKLRPEDFYLPAHREIFRVIIELVEDFKAVDIVTVSDALDSRGRLKRCGGAEYLATCFDVVPVVSNIDEYVATVKDKSTLRRLIYFTQKIHDDAWKSEAPQDLLSAIQSEIIHIISEDQSGGPVLMGEVVRKEIDALDNEFTEDDLRVGYGFPPIDKATAGMGRGDLVVIGGTPSMGKSSLALQICLNAAKAGSSCLYYSLEMTKERLAQRALALLSGISSYYIRVRKLTDKQAEILIKAASDIYGSRFLIDDSSVLSLYDVQARSRQAKMMYDVDVIVLDYLGLMKLPDVENRAHAYGDIAKMCKNLAKDIDCTFILVSQLSRAVQNKKPRLYHLRESGDIEASADIVMFVYRKEKNSTRGSIIIAKDRNHGGTGEWDMAFDHLRTRFIPEGHPDFDEIWDAGDKQELIEREKTKRMLSQKSTTQQVTIPPKEDKDVDDFMEEQFLLSSTEIEEGEENENHQ